MDSIGSNARQVDGLGDFCEAGAGAKGGRSGQSKGVGLGGAMFPPLPHGGGGAREGVLNGKSRRVLGGNDVGLRLGYWNRRKGLY